MRDEGNVFRPEVYFSADDVCPIPMPHPMFSKDLAARLRRPPMIYDGFMFYNELELLEIRLNELDHLVDKFILVEADTTFSGKKKPLVFHENKALFEKFLPKIIHVVVSDMPGGSDPWVRERFQRNAIARGIPKDAKDTDLLIVSDVDEIPKAETIAKALPITTTKALDMGAYSGYLNVLWGGWSHAKICPIASIRASDPQTIRHQGHEHIQDAGWHFSYMGGAERVCDKMSAFAHQEPQIQKYNNLDSMKRSLGAGEGVFGGVAAFLEINERFPKYVVENREKFKKLIGPPTRE
jgi:beta-1,4-mannosyl-glycoprotein beta-1,4-N-acetylglucosaminyltransferase